MSQNTHRLLSAANSVNATSVTTTPTTVTGIDGFNAGTITYLKLYDKATAPDENDTPRRTIYIAANTSFRYDFTLLFTRGLAYRMTTAGADNSTAAVAAAAILALNIDHR
jgi:ribonuclease HII